MKTQQSRKPYKLFHDEAILYAIFLILSVSAMLFDLGVAS